MSTMKACVAAAIALSTLPILLNAQKPAKPPKPGGTPANPAIAYQQSRRGWDLMVMDADGRNQTRLVAGGHNTMPSWSPDGEWIAFARSDVSEPGIYMIRPNGTGLCKIVSILSSVFSTPTWSPRPIDGSFKIVYGDRAVGETRTDLFAVDATCGAAAPQQLTFSPLASESWPAWSIDDVLAVSVIEMGANADVHLFDISLDATGISLGSGTNVSGSGLLAGGDVCCVTWTQDGTELVATGQIPGVPYDLWLISPTAPADPVNLTGTPTLSERRPTWSPDFTKLAFDADNAIYTVDVDGTTTSNLTLLARSKSGHLAFPSWRPVQ